MFLFLRLQGFFSVLGFFKRFYYGFQGFIFLDFKNVFKFFFSVFSDFLRTSVLFVCFSWFLGFFMALELQNFGIFFFKVLGFFRVFLVCLQFFRILGVFWGVQYSFYRFRILEFQCFEGFFKTFIKISKKLLTNIKRTIIINKC